MLSSALFVFLLWAQDYLNLLTDASPKEAHNKV